MNESDDDIEKIEYPVCSGCGAALEEDADINDEHSYCTPCREHFLVDVPELDPSLCDTCRAPLDGDISMYRDGLRLCAECLEALNDSEDVPVVDLPIILDPHGVPCLECGAILHQDHNRSYRFTCDSCGSVVRSLVAYWNVSDRELFNFRLGGALLYLFPALIMFAAAVVTLIMEVYIVPFVLILPVILFTLKGIMWLRRSLRGGGKIYIFRDGVRTAAGDMLWSDDWHTRGAIARLWDVECRGGRLPAMVLMYRGGRIGELAIPIPDGHRHATATFVNYFKAREIENE